MPRNIDAEYQTTVNDVIVSIEKVLPLLKQKNRAAGGIAVSPVLHGEGRVSIPCPGNTAPGRRPETVPCSGSGYGRSRLRRVRRCRIHPAAECTGYCRWIRRRWRSE